MVAAMSAENDASNASDQPTGENAEGAAPSSTPPSASSPAPSDPVAQLKSELDATRDKYLRAAADFDNYRKRARRDVDDAEKRGKEGLLRDLLPVFDNLERAATSAAHAPEAKAIADGVQMVLKQFTGTLERAGIKRVATVGSPFDPNQHEAIQQIETADQAPGTVIAEVQAGYLLGDRLVRAAMVVVAKAPSPKPEN